MNCLSATTDLDEYPCRVVEIIEKYDSYGRGKLIAAARKIATPAQRKALRGVP
jgi:hypothetical protein